MQPQELGKKKVAQVQFYIKQMKKRDPRVISYASSDMLGSHLEIEIFHRTR
jgi:hypothetical protein